MNKAHYMKRRNKYHPQKLKCIFILESPPTSGKYFYKKRGKTNEPLFLAMMKLLGFTANNKHEGLNHFQCCGYLIVDATYQPIDKKTDSKRKKIIKRDFPKLIADLENINQRKKIPLILVKANICRLLEQPLKENKFNVLNDGRVVYFPSNGQQLKFDEQIKKILPHCRQR